MREKAELLVEMEKMSKVKDELTIELESVSSQLQQERSKVTALAETKKQVISKENFTFIRLLILITYIF